MPLYPQSTVNQGACPKSLLFRCSHFRLTFESIQELGGASNILCKCIGNLKELYNAY